jgi:RNA polymerase sigma factor (sigma-70 family)
LEDNTYEVNRLALKFAKSGGEDQNALMDLFELLTPEYQRKARSLANATGSPAEEFEEEFWLAIWKAAKSYDGSTKFTTYLFLLIINGIRNVIRRNRTKKLNMRTVSLDDLDNVALIKRLQVNPLEPLAGVLTIKKMLAEFAETNEQDYKILEMCLQDCTGSEIARSIGASLYDAKTRKTVQRARKRFKAYLDSNGYLAS